MAHERTRSVVELITNIAVAAAAIVIVWRVVFAPPDPARAGAGGPSASPLEDVEPKSLSTALTTGTRKGLASAPVVLIEYSDYECPFCGRYARETFSQIDKEFVEGGKIQYIFRNFPLSIHPAAPKAAAAAECAGAQGKYWEMHNRLFASQADLGSAVWLREAPALQLNVPSFEECMSGAMEPRVKADLDEGSRLGVQATPTFFVGRVEEDGKTVRLLTRIRGAHPLSVFQDALNEVLPKS